MLILLLLLNSNPMLRVVGGWFCPSPLMLKSVPFLSEPGDVTGGYFTQVSAIYTRAPAVSTLNNLSLALYRLHM